MIPTNATKERCRLLKAHKDGTSPSMVLHKARLELERQAREATISEPDSIDDAVDSQKASTMVEEGGGGE